MCFLYRLNKQDVMHQLESFMGAAKWIILCLDRGKLANYSYIWDLYLVAPDSYLPY